MIITYLKIKISIKFSAFNFKRGKFILILEIRIKCIIANVNCAMLYVCKTETTQYTVVEEEILLYLKGWSYHTLSKALETCKNKIPRPGDHFLLNLMDWGVICSKANLGTWESFWDLRLGMIFLSMILSNNLLSTGNALMGPYKVRLI